MQSIPTTITGHLVAVTRTAYDGFTDQQGREVSGGVKYSVHLCPSFTDAPQQLRVKEPSLWNDLAKLEPWDLLAVKCTVQARGGGNQSRLEMSLESFELLDGQA